MPDRASVFERVAIAKESPSGTFKTPTRILASIAMKPTIAVETNQFKPSGYKWNTVSVLNKEWATSGVEGVPDFNELPYALCSVFRDAAPTTPGGATLTREWTIFPTTSSADTPAAYTVEAGSEARAAQATYMLFTDFGVKYARNGGFSVSGSVMGQRLFDNKIFYLRISGTPTGGTYTITVGGNTTAGIAHNATAAAVQSALAALASVGANNVTVTGTAPDYVITFTGAFRTAELPVTVQIGTVSLTGGTSPNVTLTRTAPGATQLDTRPLIPTQFEARFASTQAGLAGGTIFTRLLELEWKVSGRWGPIWTLNRNIDSWAGAIETEPSGEVKFKVGADEQGMAFMNNLRKGDTLFIRADCLGDTIESTFAYQFTTDVSCKITDISPVGDTDGLVSVTYTATLAHDATWGRAISAFVRNTLTAL